MRERRPRAFQRTQARGQPCVFLLSICVKCFLFAVSALIILMLGYIYTHHALLLASSRQQLDSKPDLEPPEQKALETKAGMSYYINPNSPLLNDPPRSNIRLRDVDTRQQEQRYEQTKRRIAYAITITKDGFFQDGAAILAYSIYNNSRYASYYEYLVECIHHIELI